MKRIACLGWGSLIWDPRELPIQRQWFSDGPFLPVEYLRKSQDGRMTLVLHESAVPVRSLWAVMDSSDIDVAQKALCLREGVAEKHVGVWRQGDDAPCLISGLPDWADRQGLHAVVWTALPPKFDGKQAGAPPSVDDVTDYLKGLVGNLRDNAERYVRNTPRQIDTLYRRRIEAALGWNPA